MLDITHSPYKPTGLNFQFTGTGLDFAEYCASTHKLIAAVTGQAAIAELLSPQYFSPTNSQKRFGILLVHGLLDSPYCLQDVFEYFKTQQYCVKSILLPGHGTVVGDLLTAKLEAWQAATRFAIESFRNQVDQLVVIGYSMGTMLALEQAYFNKAVAGLVLFAPVFRINSHFGWLAQWHSLLSHRWPSFQWLKLAKENDIGRYQSLPFNAAHQVYRLTQHIDRLQSQHTAPPIMLVTSEADVVVDNKIAYEFFCNHNNPKNRAIHYCNSSKTLPISDTRIEPRPSRYQDPIIDFSHGCLATAAENPHWGQHRDFRDFSHYENRHGEIRQNFKNRPYALGSPSRYNMRHYYLERLHYNPDFHSMMQRVDDFISGL